MFMGDLIRSRACAAAMLLLLLAACCDDLIALYMHFITAVQPLACAPVCATDTSTHLCVCGVRCVDAACAN